MKSSSWRLRRRSTGHLPQDVLQQLSSTSHQPVHERTKSFDLLPIDEDPSHASPRQIRKNQSFTDNNELKSNSGAKMASGSGSGTSKKKKATFVSFMPPVIGSRSNSPSLPPGGSTSGNDSDSLSSRSSVSTVISPKSLQHNPSFSSADWTFQRETTYEEELELQLHKITGAAQQWKLKFISEHAMCGRINKLLLDREKEYKSVLKALTAQYDSQIVEVRNKLFLTLDTADALAEENKRMAADLKDLQQKGTMRTNALEARITEALNEVIVLKEEINAMHKRSQELESEKDQLSRENETLKNRVNDVVLSEKKLKEVHENEKWSEYYRIILDLALDKLRSIDHHTNATKSKSEQSSTKTFDSRDNNQTVRNHSDFLHLSPPMDARSMDSMTSLESLLSDINDSINSGLKVANPEVDYNDNVTTKKRVQGSPRLAESIMHSQRLAQIAVNHQRQASEPLALTSGSENVLSLSSGSESRASSLSVSHSDGNLSSLELAVRDDLYRQFDKEQLPKSLAAYPMPTLLETPAERSLEKKRQNFVKSYSDDVPSDKRPPGISVSDSNLPLQRVLSDGAAEGVKKSANSPYNSPPNKVRAHAKKASRQMNIIKRWQAGEIEIPKFPWKRRHTQDNINTKQSDTENTGSLPRTRASSLLQEKLAFISQTRSQEDLTSYDDIPPIIIQRSGSITSDSSVSVDFDLDPTKGEDQAASVSKATQSGFERLRLRRNGVTDVPEMRKPPTKGGKTRNRPKSADTILDMNDDLTASGKAEGKHTKHKFFKRKARSVKK